MHCAGSNGKAWRALPWLSVCVQVLELRREEVPVVQHLLQPGRDAAGIVRGREVARDDDQLAVARSVLVGGEFHAGCGDSGVERGDCRCCRLVATRAATARLPALALLMLLVHALLLRGVDLSPPAPGAATTAAVQLRTIAAPAPAEPEPAPPPPPLAAVAPPAPPRPARPPARPWRCPGGTGVARRRSLRAARAAVRAGAEPAAAGQRRRGADACGVGGGGPGAVGGRHACLGACVGSRGSRRRRAAAALRHADPAARHAALRAAAWPPGRQRRAALAARGRPLHAAAGGFSGRPERADAGQRGRARRPRPGAVAFHRPAGAPRRGGGQLPARGRANPLFRAVDGGAAGSPACRTG